MVIMSDRNIKDEYVKIDCCCLDCGQLTGPESQPDCACDGGPIFNEEMCSVCPKKSFCDVPKYPLLYEA